MSQFIMSMSWTTKRVSSQWPTLFSQMLLTYSTKQTSLKSVGEKLAKFEGGSVDLKLEKENGLAIILFNNPEKMNSFTGKMMVDMERHISFLESWSEGKALLMMGSNGHFCTGGDLEFVEKAYSYGNEMALFQHDALTRLHNLPLVSVALLQGYSLGGGAELSTACDFRVMSPSAKLGFIQMKMGVTTGWGAMTRLVHLLGRQKTLHLLISSKILTAKEAYHYGLVDHILPTELSVEEEVEQAKGWILSNYCQHSCEITQNVKISVASCVTNQNMKSSLDEERRVFRKFWGSQSHRKAVSSVNKNR